MPDPRILSGKTIVLIIGIIVAIVIAISSLMLASNAPDTKTPKTGADIDAEAKESSLNIIQKTTGHIQPIISLIDALHDKYNR